ncbi:MAG: glycosyltransferase [Chloroflexi bacterium]|nr:glycosyltransferase [Chloroflexota bacterium]
MAERLLVVYHRPLWRDQAGRLWEREGAFSRYLEALASEVDEVLVAAPEASPRPDGRRVEAANVRLLPLPFWDSLPAFYRALPGALLRFWRGLGAADLVNPRVPTPFGSWAWLLARLRRKPTFLLVVGDLEGVARSVPASTWKRRLYRRWVVLEEWLLQRMVEHSLTFTNGRALYVKHARPGLAIFETHNSTLAADELRRPRWPLALPAIRCLCVSRIDPRKGVRYLPVALEVLRQQGFEPSLTVVGPTVGRLGDEEKKAALAEASRLGLADQIRFRGVATLDEVKRLYQEHDVLLVPSLPGEGVPRVILEAMAAGLPVVATRVAGIPGTVHDGENGLLVEPAEGAALGKAAALIFRVLSLHDALVEGGYATAAEQTAERQAAELLRIVRAWRAGELPTESGPVSATPSAESRPVRITIPLAGLNLSGGVKSLCLLANRLAARGDRVRLVVPDYADRTPVPLDPRVELRRLRTAGPGPLRKLVYFARLSWQAARDADLALANYYLTAYPTLVSWLLSSRRARLAYNVRGYEPWSHGLMAPTGRAGRYLRFTLAWLSYRLPFKKLVTTEWLRERVDDSRALVVGHGIDLAVFNPGAEGAPVASGAEDRPLVGVIGRLGAVKGYPDFLRAAALLNEKLPARLLVVRADPVPLPERHDTETVLAPTEQAMADFYRRCDVFVFPSLAEGFGLPALEAMACGCAVVTTDCGGVRAFARDGENCLMVPPGQPSALAKAIERLATGPALRETLARGGLETAVAFDRERSEGRLADWLERLARREL